MGYKQEVTRANDDGEPSNSAGKPILGQIYSKEITNVLIIVVRYFGGTLLGVGGLITAYKSSAEDALNNAQIIKKTIDDRIEVAFGYDEMNFVMRVLKHPDVNIIKQDFMESCSIVFTVRKSLSALLLQKLNDQKNIEAKFQ